MPWDLRCLTLYGSAVESCDVQLHRDAPLYKLVLGYMTDDEYSALQTALMTDPEAGPVVPGSGGVRKLRWAAPGRGKRGGYRVIYYVRRAHGVIWMLTMYPKIVAGNIPGHVLRQIRKEVEDG